MLIAVEGTKADSHWTDTACELLRGLLVYVASFSGDRCTMAEMRRIVTAPVDYLTATSDDMTADPKRGQCIYRTSDPKYISFIACQDSCVIHRGVCSVSFRFSLSSKFQRESLFNNKSLRP